MTGEMSWIKPDGTDSNGDQYVLHARIARALRCELRPFDRYIGPYIAHKRGKLWLQYDDTGEGTICLWPGGIAPAYCAPIVRTYFPFNDLREALAAARAVLAIV